MSIRHTIIAHSNLLRHTLRLEAARCRIHGRQILSFEQLACRLAGGFVCGIDEDTLRDTIQRALPKTDLGELNEIKHLPGTVNASAETLRKAWRAGIKLASKTHEHPRLQSIANLEQAVLKLLPSSMLRPADIAEKAFLRLEHAKAIFGEIQIVGITELSPCWRPLLHALCKQASVRWVAGPRGVPAWLEHQIVPVESSEPETPEVVCVSAATAHHEAIEAMRWARDLMASGVAKPEEIAIAAAGTADYDDSFLSLRADANIDLHFVHGVRVVTTREGQAVAALADVLTRGLSQTRVRRLAALAGDGPLFKKLPEGWMRVLPADAPLSSLASWERLLGRLEASDWPDEVDHSSDLREIVKLLDGGVKNAAASGELILIGKPLSIWCAALRSGPPASIEATIDGMRQPDGLEGAVCVAWMPANELAACPRPFVRLLGLNSSRWPRARSEDRLLSDHIVPSSELDPLPLSEADRRDFATILATTRKQVVMSRARRDSEGRLLGRSPLLPNAVAEIYLRRNAVPVHAMSEADRLLARPAEFAAGPQAISAARCWSNWRSREITPHDGLVRADHPVIQAMVARPQSASSLSALLRNPLGYLWRYGLHFNPPRLSDETGFTLDTLQFGNLVHGILDRALRDLKASGALGAADRIEHAVEKAAAEAGDELDAEQGLPPLLIWRRQLDDARQLARQSLAAQDFDIAGGNSFSEVAFGGAKPKHDAEPPWPEGSAVTIPGAGFSLQGYIDRLDLSADIASALVRDYKTGKSPKEDFVLKGGSELQRCLYSYAVKAILGQHVNVSAVLFYARDGIPMPLQDPDATLKELTTHLVAARASVMAGNCLIGPDTGGEYDDRAFALPANRAAFYLGNKLIASTERLGPAAAIWEAV
jgi:hypothetical protein